MESQCVGLAEALGADPVVKRIQVRQPWRWMPPLWVPNPLASLGPKKDQLTPPWPDILIASGRQSVAVSIAIRAASAGATFTIQIQNPAVDPALPKNRLGLAKWLVDPANPLVARVTVNRWWAQLFGQGIVATLEDFGTQSAPPTHPELLDWLAREYVESGWDTKALLATIVTSATYRQASDVSPENLARDPEGELHARGPRFRMDAEMVRDVLLATSGLLSRRMHGPSVFPPQPEGMWQAAFNGQRTWTESTGEDRYRRALYVFLRRTIPYPSLATFDATSRETCTLRRTRTNTPLQAFVTLNDPAYVEAAQAFARRIVREGGESARERAAYGLELSLVRPADDDRVAVALALFESELAHYTADESAALALATEPLGPLEEGESAPELAAWTVVANVLLNQDAVLVKD